MGRAADRLWQRLFGAGDAALLVGCVRIEDYRCLTDLDFAVPEFSGALIDVQHRPRRVHLGIHQAEATRNRACAEETLARAQHYGKLPDPERINQIVREEGLEEVAAAM